MKRTKQQAAEAPAAAEPPIDESGFSEFVVTLNNTPGFGSVKVFARDAAHAVDRAKANRPEYAGRDSRNFTARLVKAPAADVFKEAAELKKADATPVNPGVE